MYVLVKTRFLQNSRPREPKNGGEGGGGGAGAVELKCLTDVETPSDSSYWEIWDLEGLRNRDSTEKTKRKQQL